MIPKKRLLIIDSSAEGAMGYNLFSLRAGGKLELARLQRPGELPRETLLDYDAYFIHASDIELEGFKKLREARPSAWIYMPFGGATGMNLVEANSRNLDVWAGIDIKFSLYPGIEECDAIIKQILSGPRRQT